MCKEEFKDGDRNPNNPEQRFYICPICGRGEFIDALEYNYATDIVVSVNTLYLCKDCYKERHGNDNRFD